MEGSLSLREERLNALTHGLGALASAGGAAVLITFASLRGDPWRIVSVAVFGGSLVLLYTVSTLYHYHGARAPRVRARLRVLDHASIYLLIAGTYTPFVLGPLRGPWGWALFGVAWGLAVAGVIFKLGWTGSFPRLSTGIYIGMGWVALVAVVPLVTRLPGITLFWLVTGGLVYTAGTLFYHHQRLPYAHTIWHLFVLAGSACHWAAVATL